MTLRYRDFVPELHTTKILGPLSHSEYEPLTAVVDRVNAWLIGSRVQVINVETVLRTAKDLDPREPDRPDFRGLSGFGSEYWVQVVRVWYREAE